MEIVIYKASNLLECLQSFVERQSVNMSDTVKELAMLRRKILRNVNQTVTKPAICRLARCGGDSRMSGIIHSETLMVLQRLLQDIIRDAFRYTEHEMINTITATNFVCALKRQSHTIYRFGR